MVRPLHLWPHYLHNSQQKIYRIPETKQIRHPSNHPRFRRRTARSTVRIANHVRFPEYVDHVAIIFNDCKITNRNVANTCYFIPPGFVRFSSRTQNIVRVSSAKGGYSSPQELKNEQKNALQKPKRKSTNCCYASSIRMTRKPNPAHNIHAYQCKYDQYCMNSTSTLVTIHAHIRIPSSCVPVHIRKIQRTGRQVHYIFCVISSSSLSQQTDVKKLQLADIKMCTYSYDENVDSST